LVAAAAEHQVAVVRAGELHHHSQQAERTISRSALEVEVALEALVVAVEQQAAHVVFQELTLLTAAVAEPLMEMEFLEDVVEALGGRTQDRHLAAAAIKEAMVEEHKTTQAAVLLMVVVAEVVVLAEMVATLVGTTLVAAAQA
jgi:hypothetical protein